MFRRISCAALLAASMMSAPALAAPGTAAGGIEALKNYNLIVLGDFKIGHDVEGKALVTGKVTGTSQVGIGSTNGQGQAASSTVAIFTAGSLGNGADVKVHNGSNGAVGASLNGTVVTAKVAGDVSGAYLTLNTNGGSTRSFEIGGSYCCSNSMTMGAGDIGKVGGNFQNVNHDGGILRVGGTASGNLNGSDRQVGIATNNAAPFYDANFQTDLAGAISSTLDQVKNDVTTLSATLAGLSASALSTHSMAGTKMTLNAVDGGGGFALFDYDVSDFAGITDLIYNFGSTSLPVIVNVHGATANFAFNNEGSNEVNNQQVIWNFVDATSVSFSDEFYGSVLAVNATVTNITPIEGSVVAKAFNQGGEVHLGTYNGRTPFLTPPPSVPEPATWAMMIGGLGLVGASMRRRTKVAFA